MEANDSDSTQSLSFALSQLAKQIKISEQRETELMEAHCMLNAVCKHSATMMIAVDTAGIIRQFNNVAESALGYLADEVIAVQTPVLFHLQEELEKRAEEMNVVLKRTAEHRIDFPSLVSLLKKHVNEWHYARKDGSKLLVSVSIVSADSCGIKERGFLVLATDISEKKKPEMELLAALKKEKELNELKSRFVSMASHEFRTPLGAVLSSAYLVSKYKKEEQQPQREKHIQQIVSSVNSLTEILDDFLSVGKIEEGNIHPQFVSFDLKDHMERMIHDVSHLLKQYQNITYKHEGTNTKVVLDPSMLKHIVLNLLSNAIKFSTDESTIEVYTERNENEFILKVKDHGIGIPRDEQDNLFKIFFRSSYATNIQGTGLGLHIVKKYVEFMGGSINFNSEIGEGTEFIIHFNIDNN